MAHHQLRPPVTEAQVRALRVNDTVTLEGTLFGIRDANQIGSSTRADHPLDLRGHPRCTPRPM